MADMNAGTNNNSNGNAGFNLGTAQTPQQIAAGLQASNPGASTGRGSIDPQTLANFQNVNPGLQPNAQDFGIMAGGPPPVNQTQDANAINNSLSGNGSTTPTLPNASGPSSTNAQGINASVSIPTAPTNPLIQAPNTSAQNQQQTLLQKLAAMIGGNTSLATNQTTAESAAGIPDMSKHIQDLTNQLQGLSDQGTLLANAGAPGGSIENQEQQNAQGRGITAGGLAPMNAEDLRTNEIKQQSIAAQSLQVKSTLLAAQGNYAAAKDAADKAAQVVFDSQTQAINGAQAQLAALAPQLTKDEQAQAAQTAADLADKATKVAYQKEDYTSGLGLINAAMKNNPNDPNVQLAIQAASKIDPTDPQYLQKVTDLVGKYQTDPVATQTAIYQMQKARNDAIASQPTSPNDPNATAALDPNSQSILSQTGLSVAAYNFLTQGTAALSRLSATDRKNIMSEAQNYLNKNGVDYATFQSQYKALNDVVQKNLERANNTSIYAGEVSGTADALLGVITSQDLTDLSNKGVFGIGSHQLSAQNIADLAVGKQVNNPIATKYSFQIQALANDLAGYFSASRGASQPETADLLAAGKVIADGMNSGSVQAFKESINTNEQKVAGVVNNAVDSTNKQVWNLFGVGSKYQSKTSSTNNNVTKSGKTFDYAGAIKAGHTDAEIQAYLASH